jgi:predicted O-methyltransferase YrrM
VEALRKFTPLDARLNDYVLANEPPEHEQLRMLRERTSLLPNRVLQITPEQGHLLAFLVRLTATARTLEIGTFTGYSALVMALALPPEGRVVACDISKEWTDIGRPYWERAGVSGKIELRIGPALDTLRTLEQEGAADSFDLAFIDADKTGYDDYFESALRLVRRGGVIVLDNMLWDGRVADPNDTEPNTCALRKLNMKIAGDPRVDHVLLALASGMTLVQRRA